MLTNLLKRPPRCSKRKVPKSEGSIAVSHHIHALHGKSDEDNDEVT